MPGIQLLQRPEQKPSFSQQLGAGLGGGISQGLSQALSQMMEQKKQTRQLEGLAPIFEQLGIPKEGVQQLIASGLDPKDAAHLAGQLGQQQAKMQQQQATVQQKQQEKEQKDQGMLSVLDELETILPYTGEHKIPGFKSFLGAGPIPLNRGAVEKRNQFDTMAITLEGFLRDLTTKGTLPQKTFEALLSRLPDSSLSERQNKGRINAIRRVIESHSGKTGDQPLRKVSQGTALTDDVAMKILQQSGGDPEKARENAKKMGYSWE